MKTLTAITAGFILLFAATAWADTWVNGYTRSDGSYVQGHYRSSPNGTTVDNYSSSGNLNPYTGKIGSDRRDDTYGGGSTYGNSRQFGKSSARLFER